MNTEAQGHRERIKTLCPCASVFNLSVEERLKTGSIGQFQSFAGNDDQAFFI